MAEMSIADRLLPGSEPSTSALARASGTRATRPSAVGRVRSIRAVERALHVVSLLIATERLTVAQVVKASGLPRTTAYRVLRTLVAQGFATEWPELGTFGPGPVLAKLATRSDPLAAVVEAARPFARALSEKVRWPVSVATIVGNEVVVRYSTDGEAALSYAPQHPGVRLPLLDSAAGRLHLAYGDAAERSLWLDLAYDRRSEGSVPSEPRATIEAELATIRKQGFASYAREGRLTMRRSLAAPVLGPNGMEAALVVRFAGRAIRTRQEMQQLVVELCAVADAASKAIAGATDAR
jgi:IclR family mhp operon transcriptional activator